MSLIIGIDLDGTFAADAATFAAVVRLFQQAGHRCILVTGRPGSEDDRRVVREVVGDLMPALFADGRAKHDVALEAGYDVDVWIDDNPVLVDFGAAGLALTKRGQR